MVKYYNYKVEFQARGAGHIHGVLWIDMKDDKMMGNKIFRTVHNGEELADLDQTFKAIKNNTLLDIKSKDDPATGTLSPDQKRDIIKRNTKNIAAVPKISEAI